MAMPLVDIFIAPLLAVQGAMPGRLCPPCTAQTSMISPRPRRIISCATLLLMKPQTRAFDLAEHLRTDEDIAIHLSLVIEEDEPGELAHALGVLVRARGMSQVAQDSGLPPPKALDKALRTDAPPGLHFEATRLVGA